MATLTCAHAACTCYLFVEDLNGSHIVRDGNCMNCDHAVSEHPRRPAELGGAGRAESRIALIVKSLRKHQITCPDSAVLWRISQSDNLLDFGAIDTACAYAIYEDVKNMAGTETKLYIGEVLGMQLSEPPFDVFQSILAAKDMGSFSPKLVKILRVADDSSVPKARWEQNGRFEVEASSKLRHEAIVSARHVCIDADSDVSRRVGCRVGICDVLIMPWYTTTLDKLPTGDLSAVATGGKRLLCALEYVHSQNFVHLDVKAMNVFVDVHGDLFLGDFGSCKPVGLSVTSSTFQFYFENITFRPAHPVYDWFMFLVLLVSQTLKDKRQYVPLFRRGGSEFVDRSAILEYARKLAENEIVGDLISLVLQRALAEIV